MNRRDVLRRLAAFDVEVTSEVGKLIDDVLFMGGENFCDGLLSMLRSAASTDRERTSAAWLAGLVECETVAETLERFAFADGLEPELRAESLRTMARLGRLDVTSAEHLVADATQALRVRNAAVYALGLIADQAVCAALSRLGSMGLPDEVQVHLVDALGSCNGTDPAVSEVLGISLESEDAEVRAYAMNSLVQAGGVEKYREQILQMSLTDHASVDSLASTVSALASAALEAIDDLDG